MMRLGLLGAFGLCLVALTAAGLAVRVPDWISVLPDSNLAMYVVFAGAAGAAYAASVVMVHRTPIRHGLAVVLIAAASMRVLTLSVPPLLSTDIYRYVWDGRVQAAGINPYLYLPSDPALTALRDSAIYPHINRADTAPTIYPPAAQALFAMTGLAWSSIWGVKSAMLAFDVLAIGAAMALLRTAGQPLQWVLIYAWNPLPVWEFAGGGHIDAAATGAAALALLAAVWRRPGWAGLALGAAVLFKLLPAALFPALWRRWDWRTPAACAAIVLAGYGWYAGAGWRVLGYLPGYAQEEGVGAHGAFLLRLLAEAMTLPRWAAPAYAILSLGALMALAAFVCLRAPLPDNPAARARRICRDALLLLTATMLALSPHYPWYLAPLALPAVLAPAWSVLWLTVSAPLLYFDDWHDKVIWPSLVFLPCAALLPIDLLRRQPAP